MVTADELLQSIKHERGNNNAQGTACIDLEPHLQTPLDRTVFIFDDYAVAAETVFIRGTGNALPAKFEAISIKRVVKPTANNIDPKIYSVSLPVRLLHAVKIILELILRLRDIPLPNTTLALMPLPPPPPPPPPPPFEPKMGKNARKSE